MAPEDTPDGPNGQTTGTAPDQAAATPPGTDPNSTQDPLKVAAQTRLAVDLMNGNTFEALELIRQGVNPNAVNALGTTALGGVNENANSVSGVDLSVLNASTVAAAAPAPGTLLPTADGGVTTDPALAAPKEHHHHRGEEPEAILPLVEGAALGGAAGLDVAAVTAMEMGDVGLATRLEQKAEDLTEQDNNDQQNNDDGTEGGPSLLQQEADTGIVVDGTISDVGINDDSYMSPTEFDDGTDASNIAMSSFAPAPSYFPDDSFDETGTNSFSTGADPFASTPNYFPDSAGLGPDPFAPTPGGFSLGAGATTLSANSLSGGSLLAPDAFSIAPLSTDPLSTGAATLSASTLTAPSVTDLSAPALSTTTPSATTPATVSLDTFGAGPDPFASATTASTGAALNTGTPSSSFLGTTLSAYSPAVSADAPVTTPSTSFGDLASLSSDPVSRSVYGSSFFSPTSVASALTPPANDFSAKAPAIVAAAPRVQSSMGLS